MDIHIFLDIALVSALVVLHGPCVVVFFRAHYEIFVYISFEPDISFQKDQLKKAWMSDCTELKKLPRTWRHDFSSLFRWNSSIVLYISDLMSVVRARTFHTSCLCFIRHSNNWQWYTKRKQREKCFTTQHNRVDLELDACFEYNRNDGLPGFVVYCIAIMSIEEADRLT